MTALQASLPRGVCLELGATRLARLTLTELIDELSAALVSYRALRVSYRALRVSAEYDPRSD